MKVPFMDLKSTYMHRKEQLMAGFEDLLEKGDFVYSPRIEQFEKAVGEYLGTNAFGVSSGTAALELAFRSIGIKQNDKVIVPANSFIATALAVSNVGGIPVFVDVDPMSGNVNKSIIEQALDNNGAVAAVAVVHLYGNPVTDIKQIVDLCHMRGVRVVEDCAQAFGAEVFVAENFRDNKFKKVGTFGDVNAFSFYPAKNLGTIGNGGLVTCSDLYRKTVEQLRTYGQSSKGVSDLKGGNFNMSTIQAMFLHELLPFIDDRNKERQQAGNMYDIYIMKKLLGKVQVFLQGSSIYHLYIVVVKDQETRDSLRDFLQENGIGVGLHYPIPIHKQKAYSESNNLDLPVSERLATCSLSLPMYPSISEEQIEYVVTKMEEFFEERGE